MIKTEIMTDGGTYIVKVTGQAEPKDVYKTVLETLENGGAFTDPDSGEILAIRGEVKHIRVYREDAVSSPACQEIADPVYSQAGGNLWYHILVTYLGQKLDFALLIKATKNYLYLLPVYVNEVPLQRKIAVEKAMAILRDWAHVDKLPKEYRDDHFFVAPPSDEFQNDDEALSYLNDQIETLEDLTAGKGKNAKAFPAWNDSDKGDGK